jgi:hypothetical protein
VTDLPISPERVLDAVDARDNRGEAWAKVASEPASTDDRDDGAGESIFASGPTQGPTTPVNGSDGLSDQEPLTGVKSLLTSPSALLLVGTLGMGLLAIALYWLLHRRGVAEKKAPSGSQVLRR